MLLRKHITLADAVIKMAADGTAGTFEGYASVFGGVDTYGDTILKGAFESTLRTNGLPKMFFQHDWNMPIGRWTYAKEDDHGLYVKGEITPGLRLAEDVHAALKHGTLDGLSIGGYVKMGDFDTTETGRIIRKWSNLVEVSPVVFPADDAARIEASTVKGADILEAIEELNTLRDLESLLRDAAGFSKSAATALIGRAKHILNAQGDPVAEAESLALRAVAQRLKALAGGT